MASSKITPEQVKLAEELAAATAKIAKNAKDSADSFSSQHDAFAKLKDVMKDIDVDKLAKDTECLSEKIHDVGKKAENSGKLGNKSFTSLVKQLTNSKKSTTDVISSFKMMSKTALAAGLAIKGLVDGFRNLAAIAKGVIGFAYSFSKGVFEIGVAILSIPFKIWDGLLGRAAAMTGQMAELAQAIEDVRKQFGDLKGPGAGAVLETWKTMKGFQATGLSTWRVFGNLAERLQHVLKVATAMGSAWSIMDREFRENGGALLAFQKGLGASEEQMKAIAQRAITIGKPMSKVFIDMTKQTLALGKAFDIDQKLIGRDMAKALVDVKNFGQLTVKEIAQASVYSHKLGIELDKITGSLGAFETYDQAAENASKLTQTFGVMVDTFGLVSAQSPAEQIEMLRKSFREAGRDAASFNRQELAVLASTTGLDEATAKQVFSLKNQGVSLDKIKQKSGDAEKKTLTQSEALSKLADSIERMVKAGDQLPGSFFRTLIKGFATGIQWSEEFRGVMYEMMHGLRAVYHAGIDAGRAFVKYFPGVKEILGGYKGIARNLRSAFTEISIQFQALLNPKSGVTLEKALSNIRTAFEKAFDLNSSSFQNLKIGAIKMGTKIVELIVEGIRYMLPQVTESIRKLADFMKNPKAFIDAADENTKSFGGFLASSFKKIWSVLKEQWPTLRIALKDLFTNSLKFLVNDVWPVAKEAISDLFAMLFGKDDKQSWAGFIATGLIDLLCSAWKFVSKEYSTNPSFRDAANKILEGIALYMFGSMAVSVLAGAMTTALTSALGAIVTSGFAAAVAPVALAIAGGLVAAWFTYDWGTKLIDAIIDDITNGEERRAEAIFQAGQKAAEAARKRKEAEYSPERQSDAIAKLQLGSSSVAKPTIGDQGPLALQLGGKQISLNAAVADTSAELAKVADQASVSTDLAAHAQKAQESAKAGTKATLATVANTVKLVNDMNTALADPTLNSVNAQVKLEKVANAVGLGGSGQYTIKNKDVMINLNVQVTMDVDKVEKVLIMRKESIIRDRLEYFREHPTRKGPEAQGIPDRYTPGVIVPNIAPSST